MYIVLKKSVSLHHKTNGKLTFKNQKKMEEIEKINEIIKKNICDVTYEKISGMIIKSIELDEFRIIILIDKEKEKITYIINGKGGYGAYETNKEIYESFKTKTIINAIIDKYILF